MQNLLVEFLSCFLRIISTVTLLYSLLTYPIEFLGFWLVTGLGWGVLTIYDEWSAAYALGYDYREVLKTLAIVCLFWPVVAFLWLQQILNLENE